MAVIFPALGSGDGAAGEDGDLCSQTPLFRPEVVSGGEADFKELFGLVDLFTMGAVSDGSELFSVGRM